MHVLEHFRIKDLCCILEPDIGSRGVLDVIGKKIRPVIFHGRDSLPALPGFTNLK
ncbi:MAG: hypothetical protein WCF90_09975 [Methanomicrobiales archaeon]